MFHDLPVWALGTMSGTSLDGVDAAMVLTDGVTIMAFGPSNFRPYSDEERAVLRRGLGCWQGEDAVPAVAELTEAVHIEVMQGFDQPGRIPRVELAAFHGQTLAHDPSGRGTHQAGNGALIANRLRLPVAWDFRTADVEAGGQGAPLAPFFHHACAVWAGLSEPVIFLNLGGVGNMTWVDPNVFDPAGDGALLAFDTGPANAPINDLMERCFGTSYDHDGLIASSGQADQQIVEEVLSHPYFSKPAPKSLDRDEFTESLNPVSTLNNTSDAAATLVDIAAQAVAHGLKLCPSRPGRILVTGGGRHNPVMMSALARCTDLRVDPVEAVGLDGDMLEAQAFAWLGVRVARGLPLSGPSTTGVIGPTVGGRLSYPEEI